MRRRWSWAGAAAAAWVLAALLPAPTAGASAAGGPLEFSYSITAAPETCGYLRKDFGSRNFIYQAGWSSNASIPDYCTLEVSRLYMHSGSVDGSDASCQAALQKSRYQWSRWSTVLPNAPATTTSDADTLCDEGSIGYFYIHNSCNQTFSFSFWVRIQPTDGCQRPWQWSELFGIVFLASLLLWASIIMGQSVEHMCPGVCPGGRGGKCATYLFGPVPYADPPRAVQMAPAGTGGGAPLGAPADQRIPHRADGAGAAGESTPDSSLESSLESTPLLVVIESAPPTPRSHGLPAARQPDSTAAD